MHGGSYVPLVLLSAAAAVIFLYRIHGEIYDREWIIPFLFFNLKKNYYGILDV